MANLGPNVKKLILHKMSLDAVPAGGGLAAGVAFLSDPKAMANGWRAAVQWVREAIDVVRSGADPNPWRNADDEAIAGEILSRVEQRRMCGKRSSGVRS